MSIQSDLALMYLFPSSVHSFELSYLCLKFFSWTESYWLIGKSLVDAILKQWFSNFLILGPMKIIGDITDLECRSILTTQGSHNVSKLSW